MNAVINFAGYKAVKESVDKPYPYIMKIIWALYLI